MKMKAGLIITSILFISMPGLAQQPDTLYNPGNLSKAKDSSQNKFINIGSGSENEMPKITFNNYFTLLGWNLKQDFSKPLHMTGKDWGNFAKYAVAFAALSFSDETTQKYSVRLVNSNANVKTISSHVTMFGGSYERYGLATVAAYGLIFKKTKLANTALLATQAYLTGSAIEVVLKGLSGRTRPNYYNATEEAEPTFYGPFKKLGRDATGKKRYSSFPSGHSIVAFGAATVFAEEYKNIKAVPIIAYSAATLVALSRITENRHWSTDVLTGALIGYLTGKNVVNNYHRYAKLKASQQKRNTISYSLQYLDKQIIPGIVYKFR